MTDDSNGSNGGNGKPNGKPNGHSTDQVQYPRTVRRDPVTGCLLKTDGTGASQAELIERRKRRVTVEQYEAAWDLYRAGTRTKSTLAKLLNVSAPVAARLVDVGYPERGWKSLQDRLLAFEEEQARLREKATQDLAVEMEQEVAKARKANSQLSTATKAVLGRTLQRLISEIDGMTFKRTKRVRSGDQWVEIELPPYGPDVCISLVKLVESIERIVGVDASIFGSQQQKDDVVNGLQRGLSTISTEQAEYIIKTGKLPPGLTEEQFMQATAAIPLGQRN